MTDFREGAIVEQKEYHHKTFYDVSNRITTAQFDGRGNISRYAVINKWEIIDCFYSSFMVNGVNPDYYDKKEVTMLGRIQKVKFNAGKAQITLTQFIDNETNAVFTEYSIENLEDISAELHFNFGVNFTSYLKQLFGSRLSISNLLGIFGGFIKNKGKLRKAGIFPIEKGVVVRNNVIGDFYLDVALSLGGEALEREQIYYNQYRISVQGKDKVVMRFVLSAGTRGDFSYVDAGKCLIDFDLHIQEAQRWNSSLPCPESVKDGKMQAYYKNLINCSLGMYKERGEFKGFIAGINYQFPARTYYRDGYWTILSILPVAPELVKNEILTLSNGINKDGRCPSAVKSDFKNWWGDHYDSPSFFVTMLYDYVRKTGDKTILDSHWSGGGTVLDAAESVIKKLSEHADARGLLVKEGRYNRRDWADNVFRRGFVTYDSALYARALEGLGFLNGLKDNREKKDYYDKLFLSSKAAINDTLWDEEKGYYVNYIDGDFVEDNLSLDTVVTVLFDIAGESRARRVLEAMEKTLETRNNKEQRAGDFGVMCVYPFYKRGGDVVLKSTEPYYYHNGADWPYLSAAYAYAKLMYKMDYLYPLTRWFDYNLEKGKYTPVEFYSPPHKDGSMLQGWSALGAFVLSYPEGDFFR
jgi:hypothetical protein